MEILELATDLKGARDEINRLRADYALLADDYMQLLGDVERLRAELAECKQDAKHRITRLRDALANLHGNCYVADAPTEMIAAEEALAAEALDAARKGEGE